MSEWIQIQPFGYGDVFSGTGKALPDIVTATNQAGSISPSITHAINLDVLDETGSAITDETGSAITLEGLTYA